MLSGIPLRLQLHAKRKMKLFRFPEMYCSFCSVKLMHFLKIESKSSPSSKVMAAQFESFRDPIVILVSVPLALFGALIFINLGFTTLNVYTQVGLVTLMGLISKHGILIVEFANELQLAGRSKLDAIIEASSVRLRPILMTTAAMVLGVLPLVVASGAGAAGRQSMGIVIFTGLSIGTLFTLFVVPAMYLFIGADHHARKFTQE